MMLCTNNTSRTTTSHSLSPTTPPTSPTTPSVSATKKKDCYTDRMIEIRRFTNQSCPTKKHPSLNLGSPARSAGSFPTFCVDAAVHQINAFLAACRSYTHLTTQLLLPIPWDAWASSPDLYAAITSSSLKPRFSYNPACAQLRVWMPGPIHEAVRQWLSDELFHIVRKNWFTDAEWDLQLYTQRHSKSVRLPESIATYQHSPGATSKPPAGEKCPDWSMGPGRFPAVVAEVGASEDYATLNADMKQWLIKSGGYTNVVILVVIEESNKPKAPPSSPGSSSFAGSSEVSDAEMMMDLDDTIDPTKHIGTLVVRLELWRYNNALSSVSCDHEVVVYPAPTPPAVSEDPFLTIKDLISAWDSYTPLDPDRCWTLRLEQLRVLLEEATVEWATNTVLNRKRKKRGDTADESYVPPQKTIEKAEKCKTIDKKSFKVEHRPIKRVPWWRKKRMAKLKK